MTIEPDVPLKIGYYKLMIYPALFAGLSSLLTVGYLTLYNGGIKFFEQLSLTVPNINIWPLILLTVAGVFVGLVIKRFSQMENWELPRASMPRLAVSILAKCRAFCFRHSYRCGVELQLVPKDL